MNVFFNCVRMQSTFSDDNLRMAKPVQCMFEINDKCGILFLKKKQDKIFFNKEETISTTFHKVY